jgi:predicted RNA-binding Zn ribbon-like protein
MKQKHDLSQSNRAGSLHLLGGNMALDFANTESGRSSPQHLNHIQKAMDVVTWARHAGVIDEKRAELARATPLNSDSPLLLLAVALRQAIYAVNCALVQGRSPEVQPMNILAAMHARTLQSANLTPRDKSFAWTWAKSEKLEDAILGPIAAAAIDVLMHVDHARIKQCQGLHCGWLFHDISKNNSRRWCDMSVCGNRSKIKALRKRRQAELEDVEKPGQGP